MAPWDCCSGSVQESQIRFFSQKSTFTLGTLLRIGNQLDMNDWRNGGPPLSIHSLLHWQTGCRWLLGTQVRGGGQFQLIAGWEILSTTVLGYRCTGKNTRRAWEHQAAIFSKSFFVIIGVEASPATKAWKFEANGQRLGQHVPRCARGAICLAMANIDRTTSVTRETGL